MTAPNDSLLNEVCARLRSPFAVFERSHDHNYAVGVARMGEAADAIEALRKENDFLRAHIGNNAKACVYCGLGADEQAKCVSGFPGCARADDQMLCREAGVGIERDALAKQVRVMVAWLEEHQIDVFSRGMWDAIAIGKEEGP